LVEPDLFEGSGNPLEDGTTKNKDKDKNKGEGG